MERTGPRIDTELQHNWHRFEMNYVVLRSITNPRIVNQDNLGTAEWLARLARQRSAPVTLKAMWANSPCPAHCGRSPATPVRLTPSSPSGSFPARIPSSPITCCCLRFKRAGLPVPRPPPRPVTNAPKRTLSGASPPSAPTHRFLDPFRCHRRRPVHRAARGGRSRARTVALPHAFRSKNLVGEHVLSRDTSNFSPRIS